MIYQDFEDKKSFLSLWNELGDRGSDVLGDVKLAAFILQHWFASEPVSAAWIGMPDVSEFVAVGSLMGAGASAVILGTDTAADYRSRINVLSGLFTSNRFPAQPVTADLAVGGRWSRLLSALSAKRIGVVSVDARWALSDPLFWGEVSDLMRDSGSILRLRGVLDFRTPHVGIEVIRAMKADAGTALIAATPASLWFAPEGDAAALAEALGSSSLFEPGDKPARDAGGLAMTVAYNDWTPYFVSSGSRIIRKLYRCQAGNEPDIAFGAGWSNPEPDGRWTDGEEASVTLMLPANGAAARGLSVRGNAWVPPAEGPQRIGFAVGLSPTEWREFEFDDNGEIKTCDLDLEQSDSGRDEITLHIRAGAPGRPSDFGEPDSRLLGFKLRTISLFT